jgi:hypothetical protein
LQRPACSSWRWSPARSEDAVDHLPVPGPISFNGETYRLAWSSRPTPNCYRQEYLPASQTPEHFRSMVLLEAISQGADVQHVVSAKVDWLKERKASDPTVNFAIAKNPGTGEVILDFILSTDQIVEWNAYRYTALGGNKPGVLLLGLSRRAYGDATTEFLRALKSARPPMIDALAKSPLPAVRPRD